MSAVRTRFAPSPTGILHLGGLRTALFNFLFARQNNGKFVLRLEDTDRKRLTRNADKVIYDTLEWVQMTPDEGPPYGGKYGPYVQSERTSLYQDATNKLLASEHAYHCFCSAKRLEMLARAQNQRGENPGYDKKCRSLSKGEVEERLRRQEPFMIRFKLEDAETLVDDRVFGKVESNLGLSESDPVLLKSDGLPVYHLANVVDDHYMEISHVIRGSEWLPSTPKHLLLYKALGWKAPVFAHVPLLLNEKGQKLSKRNPDFKKYEIEFYKRKGYLPETVLTWLLSCGGGFSDDEPWSPDMTMDDLISKFKVDLLTRHSAQLSFAKLDSCGKTHFTRLMATPSGREVIANEADERFAISKAEQHQAMTKALEELLPHRISCFADLKDYLFLWRAPQPRDTAIAILAHCDPAAAERVLAEAVHLVAVGKSMEGLRCEPVPKAVAMRVVRIALFGAPNGPRVSELLESLTTPEVMRRLTATMRELSS